VESDSVDLSLPSSELPQTKMRGSDRHTLLGTSISPKNGILKMIFLFPRWDMLISWRVIPFPGLRMLNKLFDGSCFGDLRGKPLRITWITTVDGRNPKQAPDMYETL